MARAKWRTVSCADDGIRFHPSQPKAYAWVADQPAGARFRVQSNEGFDWSPYTTVRSVGDGTAEEE